MPLMVDLPAFTMPCDPASRNKARTWSSESNAVHIELLVAEIVVESGDIEIAAHRNRFGMKSLRRSHRYPPFPGPKPRTERRWD